MRSNLSSFHNFSHLPINPPPIFRNPDLGAARGRFFRRKRPPSSRRSLRCRCAQPPLRLVRPRRLPQSMEQPGKPHLQPLQSTTAKPSCYTPVLPDPQVCCKDLWYLEVSKPPAPSRVQLIKAATRSLEVSWNATPSAQYYVLQIQKFDMPASSASPAPTTAAASTASSLPSQPTVTPAIAAPLPSIGQVARPAAASPIRVQQTAAGQKILASPASPATPRAANIIRIQAATPTTTTTTSVAAATTTTTSPAVVSNMSGLGTLAAAAMTHKINMNNVSTLIPVQAGTATGATTTTQIRMKNVQPGQQIRFASPGATVLRAGSPQQPKQIILQKPGQNITGQPQIMQLVKTSQGMMAMPKMSLMPGKTVQAGAGGKPLNQGPTILRLVSPNSAGGPKILTTMKGSNLMTMSKPQSMAGKQTIMITKPGANQIGRPNQIIVVSSGSGLRTIQAVTTSQAGAAGQGATNSVNVMPFSATNHVGGQQPVKMIVVSSSAIAGGTAGKPLTISLPGQGGKAVTIATKTGTPGAIPKNQMLTMPQMQKATDALGKPLTLTMQGSGGKTVTLVPTTVGSAGVVSEGLDASKMLLVSPQKQPSATLATTSDGPATTDAALAALAAEAGLLDPVQESSAGLSFLMTRDEAKSQESCNGSQDAATVSLVEPMQVDGEGNLIIPQVDGPADLVFSDDEGEGGAAEQEEEAAAGGQDAEPSAESAPREMEEDGDRGLEQAGEQDVGQGVDENVEPGADHEVDQGVDQDVGHEVDEEVDHAAKHSVDQGVDQDAGQVADHDVAAITGDVDEPTSTAPATLERSQSTESMNVEAILSGNDGTEQQEPEEHEEFEPEKHVEQTDEAEAADTTQVDPIESALMEATEPAAEPDQSEQAEAEDDETVHKEHEHEENPDHPEGNEAENTEMAVDTTPTYADDEALSEFLATSSTEPTPSDEPAEQPAPEESNSTDCEPQLSQEAVAAEEPQEPAAQVTQAAEADAQDEKEDESEPMSVEPMTTTEPETLPAPKESPPAPKESPKPVPTSTLPAPAIAEPAAPMVTAAEPTVAAVPKPTPAVARKSTPPVVPTAPEVAKVSSEKQQQQPAAAAVAAAAPALPEIKQEDIPADEPMEDSSEAILPSPATTNGVPVEKSKPKVVRPAVRMEVKAKPQVILAEPPKIKKEKPDDTTSAADSMALTTLATAALGSTEPALPVIQPKIEQQNNNAHVSSLTAIRFLFYFYFYFFDVSHCMVVVAERRNTQSRGEEVGRLVRRRDNKGYQSHRSTLLPSGRSVGGYDTTVGHGFVQGQDKDTSGAGNCL